MNGVASTKWRCLPSRRLNDQLSSRTEASERFDTSTTDIPLGFDSNAENEKVINPTSHIPKPNVWQLWT